MTPGFELMPEIVNRSLHDALDWIASQLGPNMANWQYGNLHVVDFNHPMGRLSPLVEYLNVPPGPNAGGPGQMGMDGGPYTVNPGGHHHELIVPTGPEVLFVENGASYRGIYECYDDWDTSLILVPPGESGSIKGHPLSPSPDPHYGDTFLMWLNYQYTPCLYDDSVIQTKQKTTFMKPPFQTWDFYKTQYEQTFHIAIESNSTDVASFAFYRAIKKIQFEVIGFDCTIGVCNVTIPKALLDADPGDWEVVVDSTPVTPVVTENATHSFLYFSYHHSVHPVGITGTSVIGPPVGGIATPLDIFPVLFTVTVVALIFAVAIGLGTIGVFVKRGKEKR